MNENLFETISLNDIVTIGVIIKENGHENLRFYERDVYRIGTNGTIITICLKQKGDQKLTFNLYSPSIVFFEN